MVLYSTQEYVIKTFKVRGGNPNNNLSPDKFPMRPASWVVTSGDSPA